MNNPAGSKILRLVGGNKTSLESRPNMRLVAVEQLREIESDALEINLVSLACVYTGELIVLSCLVHSCDRRANPVPCLQVAMPRGGNHSRVVAFGLNAFVNQKGKGIPHQNIHTSRFHFVVSGSFWTKTRLTKAFMNHAFTLRFQLAKRHLLDVYILYIYIVLNIEIRCLLEQNMFYQNSRE